MVSLTAKNYQKLPEVKKRKDEKKKKEDYVEDLKKRQEKVRDLNAVVNFILLAPNLP